MAITTTRACWWKIS